ncbi:uncharacterized protein UTRI_04751_B [Ustilago trichophora]|uniref:Uncharacterized protein n=1 Tax=Ustilago trichophora TaxID=86804 RepID=A0A5C3EIT1_9BASI|nr:uncharacterized protein UTRI_04751_B [Ustilago trichophora]
MATSTTKPPILPPEDLSSTLSSIELLSAMWSGTDELTLSPADEKSIRSVAEYLQLPLESLGDAKSVEIKEGLPDEVCLGLKVRVDPSSDEERGNKEGVKVNVGFRLRGKSGVRLWVGARDAPDWLDRGGVEEANLILGKSMDGNQEDQGEEEEDTVGKVLNAIEGLSEWLLTLPPPQSTTNDTANTSTQSDPQSTETSTTAPQWVRRTWYYLPSLSTPSKRKDICSLALTSNPPLTGFLLAGKPGLIVIEYPLSFPSSSSPDQSSSITTPTPTQEQNLSAALALNSFWSVIKTTSWSDIPASHKKISEKLTEECTLRAFTGFQDVTDNPEVERGADRGRKSDLSKLIKWLDAKGVSGKWVMERCLGVGSWEM